MKRSTLFALLLFGAFLLVAVLINQNPFSQAPAATLTPEPTPYFLVGLEENSITRIEVTSKDGNVTIGRDNQGLWTLIQPINPAIDLGTLEMRITDLLNLRAKQIVQAQLSDQEIGLDQPTMTATITTNDGTVLTYRVGSQNPIGSGYYARGKDNQIVLLNLVAVENVLHLITSSYATATPTLEPLGTPQPGSN